MTTSTDDREFWAAFNEAENEADAAILALLATSQDDREGRIS
jgi:hypothetical protein